jgi:hypothetical protein
MASSGGPIVASSSYSTAPANQEAGASPYTYTNSNAYVEDVMVAGGTVTAIDFSRNGSTWYATGLIINTVTLSPGDKIKIT